MKARTDIAKYQYKFSKDKKSNVINVIDEDNSDGSNTVKTFDAILKDIKSNARTKK